MMGSTDALDFGGLDGLPSQVIRIIRVIMSGDLLCSLHLFLDPKFVQAIASSGGGSRSGWGL